MILRNVNTGGVEVYNIANNQITGAAFMGTVGVDWQFSGVGNFSGLGESDMLLRNTNTGGLEVYDIANNQITNAAFIGTVGLDWQFSGVGNFSSVAGETDLLLRNTNTGGLEVYDINNNQLTGAAFLGTVGLGLAVCRHRTDSRRRRIRSGVAQRQHRRVRGLRHRQQSDHWSGEPGPGRTGLAARRLCRGSNPSTASMGSSDSSTAQLVQAMARLRRRQRRGATVLNAVASQRRSLAAGVPGDTAARVISQSRPAPCCHRLRVFTACRRRGADWDIKVRLLSVRRLICPPIRPFGSRRGA